MRSGRNFGSFDSHYTSFKSHSIISSRSWVLVYITFARGRTDGRTDGQTFFEKVFVFLPDQEFIYMSKPISIIFQISPPFWPKLVYLFSYGNGYEKWSQKRPFSRNVYIFGNMYKKRLFQSDLKITIFYWYKVLIFADLWTKKYFFKIISK